MLDTVDKTCANCNSEKRVGKFYEKCSECEACTIRRVWKRNYNITEESLQKRREKYAQFENLDNRLTALEEKLSISNLTV